MEQNFSNIGHQIDVSSRANIIVILPLLMLVTSCSHRSAMSGEELHSIVRSSISFAAEAETLLDSVGQGRSTQNFAAGHFKYMADDVEQNLRQLNNSRPSRGVEQSFRESQKDVEALASELTRVSSQTSNPSTIPARRQRIEEIRKALEKTSTSL